ncbi:MAG: glycosyltransferase family 9 protein [Dysgonomonas sp.]|nr:glycosyltransferase family 9 protein [Dysgonomonas sp.]
MSKVLIIRLSSFGDVALLVPAVYSVAAKYPQDRFTVMTRKAFSPLFENLGFNINVLPLDIKKRHKGILGFFRVVRRLMPMRFTHVADEHDVLRSKVLRYFMALTGCKTAKINKERKQKNQAILNKTLNPPQKHTINRYMDVFEKLGFPAEIIFNNFFDFVPRDFSKIKTIVPEKKGKWIGIAPFSKHKGKIYPLEKMEKVVKALSEEENTTILLFGAGKEEQRVLSLWSDKYPNIINTVGKLNMEREMLLISYLDVMLSMDSANMHLASLVQTPVVSIWGATHPAIGFYGYKQHPDNAVQIELDCRPCSVYGDLPCQRGDYACLYNLSEEMVISRIHKVLNTKNI